MATILLPQTKHSQLLAAADFEHELVESFERIAIVGCVSVDSRSICLLNKSQSKCHQS